MVVRRGFDCPNIDEHMPDRRFTRVLDVLDIEEPCVKAHLIDSRGVEKIILIPTYAEAQKVVYQERPRNVESCYTDQAEQLISRNGARLFFAIQGGGSRSRFFDDVGQQLANQEHELERTVDQLKSMESRRKTSQEPVRSQEKELEGLKKQLGLAQNTLSRKRRELEEAKEKLELERPSNLGVLETEKARVEEEYDLLSRQYRELVEKAKEVGAKKDPLTKQLQQHESSHRKLDEQAQQIRSESDRILNRKAALEGHRTHYEKLKGEAQARIRDHERSVDDAKLRLHEVVTMAEKEAPERVRVDKTPKALEAEVKKAERTLQQKEEQYSDREEVRRDYGNKVEEYKQIRKGLDNSRSLLLRLNESLKTRVEWWKKGRGFIARKAAALFLIALQHRGFKGKLKFDHDAGKLQILIQTSSSKEGKNTKQLSGGERSFSTVCFLLALWDVSESPFRALDEYDVFMDAVNRRISTQLIIDHASYTSRDRQFILISPQDMR